MNVQNAIRAAVLATTTIGGVTAIDAMNNTAEAKTDVYVCKKPGQTFSDGKTQCVVFQKNVSGRPDRPGPALVGGFGYITGPRDATLQFRRYGSWIAGQTGASHVLRMSNGCNGGFTKPFELNGKQEVFCGQYVLQGDAGFWQRAKTGDIKGFSSERGAISWINSFRASTTKPANDQASGELVKCAVVGVHTSFFGNARPKCDR